MEKSLKEILNSKYPHKTQMPPPSLENIFCGTVEM